MSRVRERPLAEGQDLVRANAIDESLAPAWMMKPTVPGLVTPLAVPLGRPRLSQSSQQVIVRDRHGRALDHHVESAGPSVAAAREHHVRIGTQVDGLLLRLTGREVDRVVEPHRDKRTDVRSAVGTDRRDPEELSVVQDPSRLGPRRRRRPGIAEAASSVVLGSVMLQASNELGDESVYACGEIEVREAESVAHDSNGNAGLDVGEGE